MNIKSISFRNIESKTKNIYEAVVVISQRGRQILHDRLVEKMMRENTEEEFGVLDFMSLEDGMGNYLNWFINKFVKQKD